MERKFLIAAGAMAVCVPLALHSEAARTVPASERGLYFSLPYQCNGDLNCKDWSGVGAYLGQLIFQNYWDQLDASTLKLLHGRFQHFTEFDNYSEALLPYAQLLQYEASELAAGKPSLFVTATYEGKKRPVIFTWYGNPSPFYVNNPGRAVNLRDERFIQFWVNKYVRPWMRRVNKPNMYFLVDNCTFRYDVYGVRDDQGQFVPGVTWDEPYAQNEQEFLRSIDDFFIRVRQIEPGINPICNTDAAVAPADFVTSYQNLSGIGVENMEYFYQSGDAWWRSKLYDQFLNITWAGDAGKIGILVWRVPGEADIAATMRRNYMHYLMVRGSNFFFAPHFRDSANNQQEVPPRYYEDMKNALGLPTQRTTITEEPGWPRGYVLYSRPTQKGIAYLNWSGVTKTITLPAGREYVNSAGERVTQITIADMTGDYVLFADAVAANDPTTLAITPPNDIVAQLASPSEEQSTSICQTGPVAETVLVPPDLKPGDTYRLIFVTSITRDGTSREITDYNAFVTSVANASALSPLNARWMAIASTSAVSAPDNIGASSAPVYRLDGTRVAHSSDDLWRGSVLAPVRLTECATPLPSPFVWSGNTANGRTAAFPLGSAGLASVGSPLATDWRWIDQYPTPSFAQHHLYGISSVLTVPAVTRTASVRR